MLVLRPNRSIMQPESLACRQSSESFMFQPTPRLVSAGNCSLRNLRRYRRLDDACNFWDSIHFVSRSGRQAVNQGIEKLSGDWIRSLLSWDPVLIRACQIRLRISAGVGERWLLLGVPRRLLRRQQTRLVTPHRRQHHQRYKPSTPASSAQSPGRTIVVVSPSPGGVLSSNVTSTLCQTISADLCGEHLLLRAEMPHPPAASGSRASRNGSPPDPDGRVPQPRPRDSRIVFRSPPYHSTSRSSQGVSSRRAHSWSLTVRSFLGLGATLAGGWHVGGIYNPASSRRRQIIVTPWRRQAAQLHGRDRHRAPARHAAGGTSGVPGGPSASRIDRRLVARRRVPFGPTQDGQEGQRLDRLFQGSGTRTIIATHFSPKP